MKDTRKDAIRKYKERPTPQGIYAVRCTASGRVWVDASRNLDATRNGSWFSLRSGGHTDKPLQAEWNAHGESTLQYEILGNLEADLLPMAASDLIKQKRKHWI